jgi:hypothetical protein
MNQNTQRTMKKKAKTSNHLFIVKSLGKFISAALAFFTVLTPLFGKYGLVKLLPLPDVFSGIGVAFVTLVSLALFLMSLRLAKCKREKLCSVLSFTTLFLGVIMTLIYLSWIKEGKLISPNDFLFFTGDVIALMFYGLIIILFTITFTFITLVLYLKETCGELNEESELLQNAKMSNQMIEKENRYHRKVETKEDDSARKKVRFSIADLFWLMYQANWDLITKLYKENTSQNIYWNLFYNIAIIIVKEPNAITERSLNKSKSLIKVIQFIEIFTVNFNKEKKDRKNYIIDFAKDIIKIKSIEIKNFNKTRTTDLSAQDIYFAQIGRFYTIMGMRVEMGINRKLIKTQKVLSDICNSFKNIPLSKKWDVQNLLKIYSKKPIFDIEIKSTPASSSEKYELYINNLKEYMNFNDLKIIIDESINYAKQINKELTNMPHGSLNRNLLLLQAINVNIIIIACSLIHNPNNSNIILNSLIFLFDIKEYNHQGREKLLLGLKIKEIVNKTTNKSLISKTQEVKINEEMKKFANDKNFDLFKD